MSCIWLESSCLQDAFRSIYYWRKASAVCFSHNLDSEEKRDGVNWPDHKTLPLSEQGTLCVTGPNQVRIILLFPVVVLATIRRLRLHQTRWDENIVCKRVLFLCTVWLARVGRWLWSLRCVGLSDGGVREGLPGLWLQPARGDRVQHGPVHPEAGWGRTCPAGRKDPCESITFIFLYERAQRRLVFMLPVRPSVQPSGHSPECDVPRSVLWIFLKDSRMTWLDSVKRQGHRSRDTFVNTKPSWIEASDS